MKMQFIVRTNISGKIHIYLALNLQDIPLDSYYSFHFYFKGV